MEPVFDGGDGHGHVGRPRGGRNRRGHAGDSRHDDVLARAVALGGDLGDFFADQALEMAAIFFDPVTGRIQRQLVDRAAALLLTQRSEQGQAGCRI